MVETEDLSVIEAGTDNRTDAIVYDVIGQYSNAFSTPLNWAWPASQGRTINGSVYESVQELG